MEGVEEIRGVKVTDKIRYLGINLYCDRPKLLNSVESQIKKYMLYLKARIKSDNMDLVRILFSAFYRSLLIYYLTPVYAAGAINEDDIQRMETKILREQFNLKSDVTNADI